MVDEYEKQRIEAGVQVANSALEVQKSYTEDEIRKDQAFTEAYKIVDSFLNPVDRKPAPRMVQHKENKEYPELQGEDAANAGMQLISDVKNAIYTADGGLGLIGSYNKFKDAPKEVKEALWYMWDKYDEADLTWSAFGRGLKSMGKDPSTYTGIAAGAKIFGQKAATSMMIKRFKDMLIGATVGGAYTGGEEFVKQEIQGLEQKDYDAIMQNASIGAIVGTIAPVGIEATVKGVGALGKGISNVIQEGEQLMMQQAGGGVPPKQAEFKSVLENALTQTSQKNWSVDQLKGYLAKQGVKTEEMQWSGIEDYLADKTKVTTDEILNAINQPKLTSATLETKKINTSSEYNTPSIREIFDNSSTEDDFIIALENDYQAYQDAMRINPDLADEEEWAAKIYDELIDPSKEARDFFGIEPSTWDRLTPDERASYQEEMMAHSQYEGNGKEYARYKEYSVQGVGENYREETVSLEKGKPVYKITLDGEAISNSKAPKGFDSEEEARDYLEYIKAQNIEEADRFSIKQVENKDSYSPPGAHYDPNTLYHVRKQDTTIDGDQTLLIDEIQSDWHQQGRKDKYQQTLTKTQEKELSDLKVRMKEIKEETNKKLEEKYGMNPDQARKAKEKKEDPILDREEELLSSMKAKYDIKSMDIARDKRKARLGETPQYEETKELMKIQKEYDDIQKEFNEFRDTYTKEQSELMGDEWLIGNAKIQKYTEMGFGVPNAPYKKTWHEKAMKDQINEAINNGYDRVAWVGGDEHNARYPGRSEEQQEGMKSFYDKMLPKWTNKYIKKYDSKVEVKKLPNGLEVWSFEITDKMKKDIKEKGQPLYQVGGATVAGAAATQQGSEE